MAQRPLGIIKLRLPPPFIRGPPKGPAGWRVSATRQGVTGTKRNATGGVKLGSGTKFAVTVRGPLIVTVVEGLLALATVPVHPANMYPKLGVAAICTTVPALAKPPTSKTLGLRTAAVPPAGGE